MNYQYIAETVGQELAHLIENSDIDYSPIDAEAVDDLARGAVVLGVETIDYPDTDGLIIYLKRPAGGVVGLLIETDPDEMGLYEVLQTKAGTMQEAVHAKEL